MTAHFMFESVSVFLVALKTCTHIFQTVSQCAVHENKITYDEVDFMFNALIQNQGTKDIKFGSSNDIPTNITAWRIKKAQWAKSPLNVTDCTMLPRHRNLEFYDGSFLHVLCERKIGKLR